MSGTGKVSVEEVPVGLEDREQQDGEAPEGEGVGQAGDGPFSSLRWPPTSESSAQTRGGTSVKRPGSGRPFPIRRKR